MKKLQKHTLIIALLSILSFATTAQKYKTAIGFRFGGQTNGLTVRHFTNSKTALEGILSAGHNAILVTGLYEKFVPISGASGLNWFYGIGGHVGFFREDGYYFYNKKRVIYYDNNSAVVGIDGIIGLDYKFKNAPINIGIDIKPFMDFYSGASLFGDGALNFRFIF
jgi:hypothetical protein